MYLAIWLRFPKRCLFSFLFLKHRSCTTNQRTRAKCKQPSAPHLPSQVSLTEFLLIQLLLEAKLSHLSAPTGAQVQDHHPASFHLFLFPLEVTKTISFQSFLSSLICSKLQSSNKWSIFSPAWKYHLTLAQFLEWAEDCTPGKQIFFPRPRITPFNLYLLAVPSLH